MGRMKKKKPGQGIGDNPRSVPKKRKFHTLKAMRCFPELELKLTQGDPIPELARWLQEDMREYTHVTHNSLITILAEFRKTMGAVQLVDAVLPEYVREAKEKIRETIDEVYEIEKLYRLQIERIDQERVREIGGGLMKGRLGDEIMKAADLLKLSHDLKCDRGFYQSKDLGTLTVRPEMMLDVKLRYGDRVHNAIADPVSRGKVLALMKRMVSATSIDAVAEVVSSGET